MEHIKVDEALGVIWDNSGGDRSVFIENLYLFSIAWSRKFSVGTQFIDTC